MITMFSSAISFYYWLTFGYFFSGGEPVTESPETEAPTVQPTDTNVFSSTTDDSSECFDKNPTKCEERMKTAGENWIKGPCIKGKWVVDNCQMSCELCKANFII